MGVKQLGFSDYEQTTAAKKCTKKAIMRRFAAIGLISDKFPHVTTILSLQHLLETNKLGKEIFDVVKATSSREGWP